MCMTLAALIVTCLEFALVGDELKRSSESEPLPPTPSPNDSPIDPTPFIARATAATLPHLTFTGGRV